MWFFVVIMVTIGKPATQIGPFASLAACDRAAARAVSIDNSVKVMVPCWNKEDPDTLSMKPAEVPK